MEKMSTLVPKLNILHGKEKVGVINLSALANLLVCKFFLQHFLVTGIVCYYLL